MKIAYFLDTPKGLGGAGNLLLQRAVLMSEMHDVIVVIPSDEHGNSNDEYIKRCVLYNMRYVCMKYSAAYSFTMIDFGGSVEAAGRLEQFAIEEGIEFFHSVQLNLAVEYVSRKLKIPHLMDIYSICEDEFKICHGDIFPQFHLCDSLMYSDIWKRNLGIESRCIRPVAPLGSIKEKERHGCSLIKILMIGNLYLYKNQLAAIMAFAKCRKYVSNIELHILGYDTGGYAEECKRRVKENAIRGVFFHGFISDITPYLEESNCLLCASARESFPLSMVEALTYDLDIISTPVAGVPEIFADKENAFISKNYSEEAITVSILEYIEYCRNGKINEVRERARRTWEKYFDRKAVMGQLDAYYGEIKARGSFRGIEAFEKIKENVRETQGLVRGIDDMGESWVCKRGLYYVTVQKALRKGKIYIWGAGKWGKLTLKILRNLCSGIEVIAFIDNNKEGHIDDVPIKKPDEIEYDKKHFYSVSFAAGREEVITYLQSKGLALYENIWCLPS